MRSLCRPWMVTKWLPTQVRWPSSQSYDTDTSVGMAKLGYLLGFAHLQLSDFIKYSALGLSKMLETRPMMQSGSSWFSSGPSEPNCDPDLERGASRPRSWWDWNEIAWLTRLDLLKAKSRSSQHFEPINSHRKCQYSENGRLFISFDNLWPDPWLFKLFLARDIFSYAKSVWWAFINRFGAVESLKIMS